MKIDRVTYQKIFPIDAYVNQKVGIEASVDEGEDVNSVLDKLKELSESWNKTTVHERSYDIPVINTDHEPIPKYTIKNLKPNNTNGKENC